MSLKQDNAIRSWRTLTPTFRVKMSNLNYCMTSCILITFEITMIMNFYIEFVFISRNGINRFHSDHFVFDQFLFHHECCPLR